jgi:ribose-phosphate pyrophosphokinase
MRSLIVPFPDNGETAASLAKRLDAEVGAVTWRRFPDGETYVRIDAPMTGRATILVCTLSRPDEKMLPLLLTAATAKDLGASRVGLVAPYLAYMRQDARFQPGEGVTSAYVARLLSQAVDWLVTVDPHLHRRRSLAEVYSIPTRVARAAPLIAKWIRRHVPSPVVVGPDGESAQWAQAVADEAGAPSVVLNKTRRGDREVEVSFPDAERWKGYTPVVVDDLISTAHTMIETVGHVKRAGLPAPICVAVHAVFAERAYADLVAAGPARVLTCNTVPHASNGLDATGLLADGVQEIRMV